MENFEYCGNNPRKPWLLGQLSVVTMLLQDAAMLARLGAAGRLQDDTAIRYKVMAAHDVLAAMASRASHCDLAAELDAALVDMASLAKMMSDGTTLSYDQVHETTLRLVKITIKIGKVIITIEF